MLKLERFLECGRGEIVGEDKKNWQTPLPLTVKIAPTADQPSGQAA
jgi:hypothetical protein